MGLAMLAAFPAAAGESPWQGEWIGKGNDNRGDAFKVAIRFFADGSASVAYEGELEGERYACRGQLLALAARAGRRTFREAMMQQGCLNQAEVTLSPKDDDLGFRWRGVENGQPVEAETTLARPAQPAP
jgi:hypothetical protein